jgi:uncharacterized protein (TIGR02271 family)
MAGGFAADSISMTGGDQAQATTRPAATTAPEPHHEGGIAHFFRSLFGEDDDDAGYRDTYGEAFRRGSYGVTVTTTNEDEMDRAERILNDCGAVDIDEKSEQWRKEGWTGAALGGAAAAAKSGATGERSVESGATQKLQEVEEQLQVGKRAVAKGGVRIFTRMTETPVEETLRLREERAKVERRAVDRPATEADFAAFKEGSIEVREMSEEAVVSKSARVTGEVSVGKEVSEREEVVRDKVRKTKVEVEQLEPGSGASRAAGTDSTSTGTSRSTNRDPLTGAPGSHPVGTAVGATAGGVAAGAAAGSVAGPVGTAVGAVVGAVAGGAAGKGVAEEVDPTATKRPTIKKPV